MRIDEVKNLGLSQADLIGLKSKYGPNEIVSSRKFVLLKSFISQFNNFLIILLLLSSIVSFFVGEKIDSLFIFSIVLINALFGLYQEFKAEKSITSLKKMTVTRVRIIRDGKEQEIDSKDLFPGDVLYLEEGSKVPADCKILHSRYLEVDESVLTGESLPVVKGTGNDNQEIYMGTVVVKGRTYVRVTKTGRDTRFGSIAESLSEIGEVKTPLQKKLEVLTKQIGFIGIIAAFVVFGLSFVGDKTTIESFLLAVSLMVAAVPEGLPVVMTIILSIGVENMAKQKTIVRKLNAIETMGSLTLIATDKTGTLTTNQMRVKKEFFYGQKSYSKILQASMLCSTASLVKRKNSEGFDVVGDTTEGALLFMAQEKGFDITKERIAWTVDDEIPFNSTTKRMTVEVSNNKSRIIYSKGAPESILDICNKIEKNGKVVKLTAELKKKIKDGFENYATEGLRLMAFSYKVENKGHLDANQIFLGFVGIADPIRPEVKEAVKTAKNAGIRTVMITGDNELTAESVAVETGIIQKGERMLTGKEIRVMSDNELKDSLNQVSVYARTSPEDKHRLVKLFQDLGETVAVTGDGVNDALALKQANVGVAMGITGTDVAKDTAHVVIMDDNFATLINAVWQGRNIYEQIKNTIKYLLGCNVGEVFYVIISLITGTHGLTAIQLLYINVITDGLPAISLAFSPKDGDVLKQQPRKEINILQTRDYRYISIVGLVTVFLVWILTYLGYKEVAVFSAFVFIQQAILIDVFIGHRSIMNNWKKLLKPIFLVAFFMPFLLHPFIIYNSQLRSLFDITIISSRELIMLSVYSGLALIGLKLTRKLYAYKY